jgi:tetratricopeptide (TPR) repeat protein
LRFRFSRLTALVLPFALTLSGQASAQSAATPCSTPECAQRDQLWVPAAQLHEIKNQFVAALRQFTEAVAGTYGDEGPRLSASIDAARRALAQWDAGLRAYETMTAGLAESAERHVALGTVYLDRDRGTDALRELDAAARLDPRRADVPRLRGMAYAIAGKPAEAADAFRKASALDAADPMLAYALAQQLAALHRGDDAAGALRRFQELVWPQLRSRRADARPSAPFERIGLLRQVANVSPIFPLQAYRDGFARLLAGQYGAGLDALARAVSSDPLAGAGLADVRDAGAALRRGQLAPALNILELAVAANPARAEAHRVLGIAYRADEQFDRSAQAFADAIQRAPGDERARLGRVDALSDAGRVDDAAAVLSAMPDSGQAHYRLGQIYQTRSLFPQAVREFQAAAALVPLVGLDRLFETIGGVYVNQADFDHAVAAYLKRIDVNPNNPDAHKSLAEIYFLQGRDDEALAEFTATLLIEPRHAGALVGASQVLLRRGRFDEALDVSAQALALDGRLKDARYAHATALMRVGRADEGRRELDLFQQMQAEVKAATERQSELNTARRDAAERLQAGELDAAITAFRQALTLAPDAADLRRSLGSTLIKAGRSQEAIPVLEQAVQLEETPDARRLLADAYKGAGRLADSQTQADAAATLSARVKAERLLKLGGAR